MRDHVDLVDGADRWYLYLDGCRFDSFERLYERHDALADGYLQRTYTGATWTPDYFARVWDGEYDVTFFNGGAPLHPKPGNDVYDERDHFAEVPDPERYPWCDAIGTARPTDVAHLVRDHVQITRDEAGVVRFLQPHEPFLGLDISRGSGMVPRTKNAIENGDLTSERLRGAYEATLDWALDAVNRLVRDLDRDVVVTADHGTCLYEGDCDQVYHVRRFDEHDHLVEVPWLEVSA